MQVAATAMKTSTKAWLAGAVVVLPALFNFLAARADSNENEIRAKVAYEMMVTSVKELQEQVRDMTIAQAELRGQQTGYWTYSEPWVGKGTVTPGSPGASKYNLFDFPSRWRISPRFT